jgi:hypothetical protein
LWVIDTLNNDAGVICFKFGIADFNLNYNIVVEDIGAFKNGLKTWIFNKAFGSSASTAVCTGRRSINLGILFYNIYLQRTK